MHDLKEKISQRSAIVGILGMGYVGLPLAMEFARKGFPVVGFDVNETVVAGLARGTSHIRDIPSSLLREQVKAGRFRSSSKFQETGKCDVLIICVPTPLRKSREPDVSYILSATEKIVPRLRKGQLIVLESTTYPGTTRELVLPMLETRRLKVGKDFHLAFSPERVDPSNQKWNISNTPKVVGGMTKACSELASLLYSQVAARVVGVSSADAAEMVKLLENTFRAVNIGLVNELALMCHKLGLNVWEIIEAAATKPFGFMPFFPGPGLGGHCIPVDPTYLAWKMKALNFEPRFIELATVINANMPEYAVTRMGEILNHAGRPLKGSRILVLGAAYKPEVSDTRESPSLDVIKLLLDRGAVVSYHDPFVPALSVGGRRLRSVGLSAAGLRRVDLAAVLTAHRGVDYPLVLKNARLVFDARNAVAGAGSPRLHRL